MVLVAIWYHCWPAAVLLVSADVSKIVLWIYFPGHVHNFFFSFPWNCFIWQWYSRQGRPLSRPFNPDIILASSTIQIMIKPNRTHILHVYTRQQGNGSDFLCRLKPSGFLLHSPPCCQVWEQGNFICNMLPWE